MAEQLSLVASKRTVLKKKLKTLRKKGLVPLHLYGPDIESFSLEADINTVMNKGLPKIFGVVAVSPKDLLTTTWSNIKGKP